MTSYRFLSTDLVTGTLRDEITFDSVRYGAVRNGAAPFRATLRIDATARRLIEENGATRETANLIASRANLDPARTCIVVERNGAAAVGDGIIWDARIEAGSDTLTLYGASLWSYFRHRRISQTLTWSGVDHLQLAREVIDWAQAQPGGDIGIITGDETSGVPRDETVHAWQLTEVADLIERHAARNNGFDFRIRTVKTGPNSFERRFLIGYPKLGRSTRHVWEWGTNLRSFGYEVDGERTANRVFAVGDGEEEDQLVAVAADPNLLGPYPLLETVVSHRSVLEQSTLQAHAQAALRARRRPVELPTLHPDPDAIPTLSSYIPGDEVRIRIDRGWVQTDARWAIQSWWCDVDADGHEELTVQPATLDAAGNT